MTSAERQRASNSIVSTVGLYAALLADAERDVEQLAASVEAMIEANDKNVTSFTQQVDYWKALAESNDKVATELQAEVDRLQKTIESLRARLGDG